MVLILCLGDLHVPHRVQDLPAQFKELLKPGKIHSILCAGNACSKSLLEYLKSITSDVTMVQGDFDEFASRECVVQQLGEFRVGLIHGHQIVPWGNQSAVALLHRQLGVDVLITGHTHEHKIQKTEDGLHISLGSATGAYSCTQHEGTPSFVLLDVDGAKITAYTYSLVGGKVKVDKTEHTKAASIAAA